MGPSFANETMPTDRSRQCLESYIRGAGAIEIVDEPASARRLLHPAKKLQNLLIVEMVRKQGTDDDIDCPILCVQ